MRNVMLKLCVPESVAKRNEFLLEQTRVLSPEISQPLTIESHGSTSFSNHPRLEGVGTFISAFSGVALWPVILSICMR